MQTKTNKKTLKNTVKGGSISNHKYMTIIFNIFNEPLRSYVDIKFCCAQVHLFC